MGRTLVKICRTWLCLLPLLALGLAVPSAHAREAAREGKAALKSAAKPSASQGDGKARAATSQRQSARKPNAAAAKRVRAAPAPRPTAGMRAGLHAVEDPLALKSSVAFVLDQDTDEVLVSKNATAVLPIASITKLMTAMVVTEAELPLDEHIRITNDDVAAFRSRSSRLTAGSSFTRGELLHLALMASENRAAHALGRSHPGGMARFVEAMNAKADLLGMHDTRYVEPTGLSSDNRSSAKDLARLVRAASAHAVIRDYSTALEAEMDVGRRPVQFRNTNGLVRNPAWDILLQKTGFISEAGRCVVMQAQMAGRRLIMVLLDSSGKAARIGDAERIRTFIASLPAETQSQLPAATTAQ